MRPALTEPFGSKIDRRAHTSTLSTLLIAQTIRD
jgi:hypothetical protein